MSFNIALSGVNAARSELDVASNNIANVGTVGFKEARAEFGDIFASNFLGGTDTSTGQGVSLQAVAQQFNQGNLDFTQNLLDLSISGEGFFSLGPDLTSNDRIYTRAGAFGLDDEGYVQNSQGQYLQVYPMNIDGSVSATALSSTIPLRIPQDAGTPRATTEVDLSLNLPAGSTGLLPANFDSSDSSTYSASTSVNIYDSIGTEHTATMFFIRDSSTVAENDWQVRMEVDGNSISVSDGSGGTQSGFQMNFDTSGAFAGTIPASVVTEPLVFGNGSDPRQTFSLDFANNTQTQFSAPFQLASIDQDGFSVGQLSRVDISDDGVVRAAYTNGQESPLGQITLVRFENPQGLQQLGNVAWSETLESGEPLAGEAGVGTFGLIQSGALESSNVDLTKELVDLITAQRNFQANARSIETGNTITETIVNIR